MKKKSIFVVALAALMLIAFTACEQPVPGLSKAIIGADIVQTGTFLEGQPFDASKFSVNVTYSDKTTGKLDGANVVFQGNSGSVTGVKNGDVVTVSLPVSVPNYSGSTNVKTETVTFETAIVAYTIDSITVSGPATVNSTDGTAVAPKVSDLSAVASYRDSSGAVKTVNLIAADLSLVTTGDGAPAFVDEDTKAVTKDEPTALASVKVYVKWQSAAAANFQYTVQYVESTGPAPEFEYDYLLDDSTDAPVVGVQILDETSSNRRIQRGLFDADDFVAVYRILVPYNEEGTKVEKTEFEEAYTDVGLEAPEYYQLEELKPAADETLSITLTSPLDGTTDRFGEKATAGLTFKYEYIADPIKGTYGTIDNSKVASIEYDEDGAIVVTEATAPEITGLIEDYATDVDIVWIHAEEYEENAIDAGTPFAAKDFTITASEWKSGYEPETAEAVSGNVVFDPEEAPSRTSAGWTTITATYGDRTYTDSQFEVTGIRVYIAADESGN